jgi:hypothetical protein
MTRPHVESESLNKAGGLVGEKAVSMSHHLVTLGGWCRFKKDALFGRVGQPLNWVAHPLAFGIPKGARFLTVALLTRPHSPRTESNDTRIAERSLLPHHLESILRKFSVRLTVPSSPAYSPLRDPTPPMRAPPEIFLIRRTGFDILQSWKIVLLAMSGERLVV